jgi:ribosomal protein S25
MNQKQIGYILLSIGILLAVAVFMMKGAEDKKINAFIKDTGTCYLSDGTCLHDDRDFTLYIFGWILSSALVFFSVYLIVFDKTQKVLAEHQEKVSEALKEAKHKDEFSVFLSAFDDDNKKILKIVHENEGITQSTLRFKSGLSKAHLSELLQSLDKKGIIARKPKGKTYELFLKERK